MKSATLILFALIVGPTAILAQKGGYPAPARAALAPVNRKAPPPPQPIQQVQQKYEEEEDESALLAHRPTRPPRPAPPPPPPPPAPRPVYQAPPPPPPRPQVAAPQRARPQPEEGPHPAPEPYSFSYSVNDEQSGAALTREESQDANGNVVGFYHITDAEGRLRRVDYTAGPDGFKANIRSNEEGLISRDSADAHFEVEAPSAAQQAGAQRGRASQPSGAYALAGNRF